MSEQPGEISVGQALELMQQSRYTDAVEMCEDILAQMPGNATAICIRETARWSRGDDPDACIANLETALEIAPESHVVRTYLARILISNGRTERARHLLEEAILAKPEALQPFLDLVDITRFEHETALLRRMRETHATPGMRNDRKEMLGFALAKAYDDIGDAETAMGFAMDANRLARRTFNASAHRRRVDNLKELAERGLVGVPDSGYTGTGPIFIVGMPRSGTTLVETILSRHPHVYVAGELSITGAVETKIVNWLRENRGVEPGPYTYLEHVPGEVWRQNAEKIMEIMRRRAGRDFAAYTDKLPENARRLPLISRLFPNAPIVYVRRHPLDTCISNYFKRFTNLSFAFRQDWLGAYYRDLTDSVEIARRIIPNPVLDLSYELLVADPEAQTRRLVEFTGLGWDDACLRPEQSDRATVMTASRWQVRQPIYTTSTARWRRYEPWIGEMIEAMGGMEWVDAQVAEAQHAGQQIPARG